MRRRVPWMLALAAILYVALRGLILYTAFDQTALTMFELYPMGTLAELSLQGIHLPLSYFYDNAAGQILVGFLTVPFFALLGPTYLALKMVPFTLGFLTLGLVYVFLRDNFGARAASIGALLFAVAPTTLVKYSLMNSGNHFENLFFTMLTITCFYRFHKGGEKTRWLIASGFSAGFALFVFLGAILPVGLLALVHVLTRGLRRTLRDLWIAGPTFLLGLLPLILVNAATGARGLGFLGAKFGEAGDNDHGPVLARAWHFLTVDMPASSVFEPFLGMPAAVAGGLFLACFLVAYVVCAKNALRGLGVLLLGVWKAPPSDLAQRSERIKLVPLVLYLPLAALAFGLSNLRIGGHAPPLVVAGYRYFLPHLLFAILMIAISADRAIAEGGLVRAGGVALCGAALFAGTFNLAIVDWSFSRPNLGRYYPGYNLAAVGRALIASRNALSRAEILAHIESFPPVLRHRVAASIGFNLGTLQIERSREAAQQPGADPGWRLDLAALLEGYPRDLSVDLARGAGVALRFTSAIGAQGSPEIERLLIAVMQDEPPLGPCVAEGLCMTAVAPPLESKSRGILLADKVLRDTIAAPLRPSIVRGAGLLCGRLLARGIPSEMSSIREWIDEARGERDFFVGLGFGLADGNDTPCPLALWRSRIPAAMYAEVCRGFGAGLHHVHASSDASAAQRDHFGGQLAREEAEALAAGLAWTDYPAR